MKKMFSFLCLLLLLSCQKEPKTVSQGRVIHTQYIDYFWEAFDSIQSTNNYSKQFNYINRLYTEKGPEELKEYREVHEQLDDVYLILIQKYPKFWKSIRPKTLQLKERISEVNSHLDRFKKLYPEMIEAPTYLTVGGISSAGTARKGNVFLAAELLSWDETVDASEFEPKIYQWLQDALSTRRETFLHTLIHEYVHIQQELSNLRVLNLSLMEGSADFITELVFEEEFTSKHMVYGKEHYDEVLADFQKEMFTENRQNWLYNGGRHPKCGDLGYFMGYVISKSYYEKATDKKAAIKTIVELDFGEDDMVVDFLNQSGIYDEVFEVPEESLSQSESKS